MTGMTRTMVHELLDRWEQVWHEDRHELVPDCLAPVYVRHEAAGTRRITPADYTEEIAAVKRDRPNIRFTVYDHDLLADRAWFRFAMTWNDADGGAPRSRAGFQVYRIAGGKLAETWVMFFRPGSTWPDATGLDRWTSPRHA